MSRPPSNASPGSIVGAMQQCARFLALVRGGTRRSRVGSVAGIIGPTRAGRHLQPPRRVGRSVKVKFSGAQDPGHVHVAVPARDQVGGGVEGAQHRAQRRQRRGRDRVDLVDEQDIREFDLWGCR